MHGHVLSFFRNIFCAEGHFTIFLPLIASVFNDALLTERIIKTQLQNDATMQMPRGNRLNIMGHLTMLSDLVFQVIKEHSGKLLPLIQSHVQHADWIEYRELSYRETKDKDMTVLGGSKAPPPTTSHTDTEEEEEEPRRGATFNSLFVNGADEQLARYFCQQIISSLPSEFVFFNDEEEEQGHAEESIQIPFEPNGYDALLELEMRTSSLTHRKRSDGHDSSCSSSSSSESSSGDEQWPEYDDGQARKTQGHERQDRKGPVNQ